MILLTVTTQDNGSAYDADYLLCDAEVGDLQEIVETLEIWTGGYIESGNVIMHDDEDMDLSQLAEHLTKSTGHRTTPIRPQVFLIQEDS